MSTSITLLIVRENKAGGYTVDSNMRIDTYAPITQYIDECINTHTPFEVLTYYSNSYGTHYCRTNTLEGMNESALPIIW